MVRSRLPAGIESSYTLRFVLVLCGIFVLTGIAGGYIYVTVDERIEQQTQRDLVSSAENEGQQLETWLSLTDQQLTSLVRTSAVRSGDRFRTAEQLSKLTQRNAIAGVHLVDLDSGTVVIDSGRDDGLDESGRLAPAAWDRVETTVATESAGSVHYTEPFAVQNGKPVVMAIKQTEGDHTQAVVAVVDLRRLSGILYGAGYGDETHKTASVLDSNGTVVLSSDPSAILTQDAVWGADEFTTSGFGTYGTDGGVAVGHTALEGRSWTVTSQLPTAEAYALRDAVRDQILLLLGLLCAGLATLGLTIGRDTIGAVGTLADEAETLRTGALETPIETDRSDEFGTVFESLEALRSSLIAEIHAVEAEKAAAEAAREEASSARSDAERLNDHLREKAAAYGSTMHSAAAGDLTERMDPDSDSEAMTEIATAFNRTLGRIETAVANVSAFAVDVSSGSTQVLDSIEAVESSSKAVAGSIEQISHDTDQQHDSFRTVNEQLSQLSASIQEVASAAETVASTAERTAAAGHNGQQAASDAIAQMDQTTETAARAATTMNDLSTEVDRIDELIDRITEIAEQTNLLAVNASIEAARSDRSGDGFSVVASEIKTLSNEVRDTVSEVERRLETIQTLTDDSTTAVARTDEQIQQAAGDVSSAAAALDRITAAAEETNDGIQDISNATEQQATSTAEVVSMVEDVAAVSEEIAAEADAVAATATEQRHSIADVVSSVDSLAAQATTLSDTLDQFTTTSEVGATGSDDRLDGQTAVDADPVVEPSVDTPDEVVRSDDLPIDSSEQLSSRRVEPPADIAESTSD